MATAYVRNAIKLATTASSVDGYYNGYAVEFTRYYKNTGKKTVQKAIITDYVGATRIATIGGLWLQDVIPGPETATTKDTYRIIPNSADGRVSINPAIQTLDYITSDRYGKGLDPIKDLILPSWLETARYCDTQSDITVETLSVGTLAIGDIYKYPATGDIIWQGTVKSRDGLFVTFTNNLGKLTNAWNSWKVFPAGAIIYLSNRQYTVVSTGTTPTQPTHTSGTVGNLTYYSGSRVITKVSGAGPTSLSIPSNGNPIRVKKGGVYSSGYSLYDADGVDYWRYLGWDEHAQRYVTQHQTNLVIDTSQPLFDNMNSLLEHFGGMLRYSAGKYALEIEDAEGQDITTFNDPRYITGEDIMSNIKISDDGIRSMYNSLTVAFADPANKFEARNISFFNSEYLKADRNVPKKGNLSIPGITNYYNARLLAERFLIKSRFGLTVSFNMSPKGALLVAGRVIKLPYARYGWTDKKFRITDMTHNTDCSADVVATEYDDSFYKVTAVSQPPAMGKSGTAIATAIPPPTNLKATGNSTNNEGAAGIEITWTNSPKLSSLNVTTEIYASPSDNFYLTLTDLNTDLVTFTTEQAHGLRVGDTITALSDANGFDSRSSYYVQAVPSINTICFTKTKGSNVPDAFTNPGSINITIQAAILIGSVAYPESRYFDPYTSSSDGSRIQRYYWIRYKTN